MYLLCPVPLVVQTMEQLENDCIWELLPIWVLTLTTKIKLMWKIRLELPSGFVIGLQHNPVTSRRKLRYRFNCWWFSYGGLKEGTVCFCVLPNVLHLTYFYCFLLKLPYICRNFVGFFFSCHAYGNLNTSESEIFFFLWFCAPAGQCKADMVIAVCFNALHTGLCLNALANV